AVTLLRDSRDRIEHLVVGSLQVELHEPLLHCLPLEQQDVEPLDGEANAFQGRRSRALDAIARAALESRHELSELGTVEPSSGDQLEALSDFSESSRSWVG